MRCSLFLGAVLVSAFSGCGDDDDDASDGGMQVVGLDGGQDSGANAGMDAGRDANGAGEAGRESYAAIYATIISPTCTGSDCHDNSSPAGNLDMSTRNSTFEQLLDRKASGPACVNSDLTRVLSGRADMSLMVQKLEGTQTCGDKMPIGGAALSADQIARVRRWIDQGATFN